MIPVEGHKGLFRDETNHAILNTDIKGYQNYLNEKESLIHEKNRLDHLEKELEDIKKLLIKLLENK